MIKNTVQQAMEFLKLYHHDDKINPKKIFINHNGTQEYNNNTKNSIDFRKYTLQVAIRIVGSARQNALKLIYTVLYFFGMNNNNVK